MPAGPPPPVLRCATEADAAALLAIYRPFVEGTAVSFEEVPPAVAEFAARIRKSLAGWAWLVAEVDGRCAGYAYGTSWRERPAYRWSVETSAYVDPAFHGRGLGRALYAELLEILRGQGFCQAFAGITLPNPASVALHERLGFQPVGTFARAGRKFGAWHDVGWFQLRLRDLPPGE